MLIQPPPLPGYQLLIRTDNNNGTPLNESYVGYRMPTPDFPDKNRSPHPPKYCIHVFVVTGAE